MPIAAGVSGWDTQTNRPLSDFSSKSLLACFLWWSKGQPITKMKKKNLRKMIECIPKLTLLFKTRMNCRVRKARLHYTNVKVFWGVLIFYNSISQSISIKHPQYWYNRKGATKAQTWSYGVRHYRNHNTLQNAVVWIVRDTNIYMFRALLNSCFFIIATGRMKNLLL